MTLVIDIAGKTFGTWTVLERGPNAPNKKARWLCQCVCGKQSLVSGSSLRLGLSKSCSQCDGKFKVVDLTGRTFGNLKVLEIAPGRRGNRAVWLCECSCGNQDLFVGRNLTHKGTVSCKPCSLKRKGAQHAEKMRKYSPATSVRNIDGYQIWIHMLYRCTDPKSHAYADYGGRGITVCDRWRNSLDAFLEDMGPRPSKQHTLDRINNDGHYEPSNCKWSTRTEQARNTRKNVRLTHNGVTQTLPEWAEKTGIPANALQLRIRVYKWSVERALKTPVRERRAA